MKLPRIAAFLLAFTTLATLAVAGTANAGELPNLKLVAVPDTLKTGEATRLVVTGCPNRSGPGSYSEPGIVPSFVSFQPADTSNTYWYADAKAGATPGTYTLTVGCNGYPDVVSTTITITSTQAMQFTATPNPVVVGHSTRFVLSGCYNGVPPIKTAAVRGGLLVLQQAGPGMWGVETNAGDEPGTYSIIARCSDEKSSVSLKLTVLPDKTTTPPTKPVSTTPQVPVVPAGAPETGGGGMAAVVSAEPAI